MYCKQAGFEFILLIIIHTYSNRWILLRNNYKYHVKSIVFGQMAFAICHVPCQPSWFSVSAVLLSILLALTPERYIHVSLSLPKDFPLALSCSHSHENAIHVVSLSLLKDFFYPGLLAYALTAQDDSLPIAGVSLRMNRERTRIQLELKINIFDYSNFYKYISSNAYWFVN